LPVQYVTAACHLPVRLVHINLSPDLNHLDYLYKNVGTAVAQWLRRCATNRKVAGSIPGGVIGIFH
jgi:hypothetical protein